MPETLKDKKKCFKCNTVYDKKLKKRKVCQCHAITYCGRECQLADRSRHEENCVPVMVKEYEGKGLGLVAAKDIKMGELILINKAVVSSKDINGFGLDSEVERMLLNQRILKDISLLNHSCAPNAEMGLLDKKRNKELEKRFEVRAIKNIFKEDEVTIYYPTHLPFPLHAVIRALIRKNYGFVCRCVVCSGQVPNQADIVEKICEIVKNNRDVVLKMTSEEMEMTSRDWKRVAIVFGVISDLAKPLYRVSQKKQGFFVKCP